MPVLHWKIMWGYVLSKYLQGSGLKLTNVFDSAKLRTV